MNNPPTSNTTGETGGAFLVTGGSGFVGQHLVRSLSDEGHPVVSMYHHRLPESLQNVFPVCSDMGSAELLAAPLRGVETVVHLAWEGGLTGPTENVSWDPTCAAKLPRNIRLLKNLITAMERAKTRRLIFVSAIGACSNARVPFLMEKYLAEFFVLNSSIPEKIIVRSSVVWGNEGNGDRFIRSILRVMKWPAVYPVPRNNNRLAPIFIDDLVSVLRNLSLCPMDSPNALMELTGREEYRVDELFRMISDKYIRKTKVALGGFLGNSLLPLFERNSREDPRTPSLIHFLALGSSVDHRTARENPLLGAVPESLTSLRDSLPEVTQQL